MEHRPLGSLSVSIVGLGCNNFGGRIDAEASARVVHTALDAGIDFFDTADAYGGGLSEEFLGKALRGRRDRAIVATKFGAPGSAPANTKRGSADWVRTAVEGSLRRLGMERIDLYQMHFPDADVPLDETLGALDELVRAGMVREIGCSNFGSTLIQQASEISSSKGLAPFRTVQNRYSVLTRDPEAKVLPACREHGLGFIPYFPLESGLLTGKYREGEALPEGARLALFPAEQRARFLADGVLARVERLRGYATSRGRSLLELAISWLATNPQVTSVISGATRPEQVAANAAAASWRMTADERAAIDALLR
jgi:aryl-alcohol dehydrogenase-like predicted oxidoreductase